MILTEWNTEDAIAFAREEGREEGREEIFKLFEQGLSVEEIKLRLESAASKKSLSASERETSEGP